MFDEVVDKLACGLLGDPEVFSHVGGGRITFTDPRKRETMCGANIIKATESETLLNPVHKLTCESQYRNGRFPTFAIHGPSS
jgi:hypothetical protein